MILRVSRPTNVSVFPTSATIAVQHWPYISPTQWGCWSGIFLLHVLIIRITNQSTPTGTTPVTLPPGRWPAGYLYVSFHVNKHYKPLVCAIPLSRLRYGYNTFHSSVSESIPNDIWQPCLQSYKLSSPQIHISHNATLVFYIVWQPVHCHRVDRELQGHNFGLGSYQVCVRLRSTWDSFLGLYLPCLLSPPLLQRDATPLWGSREVSIISFQSEVEILLGICSYAALVKPMSLSVSYSSYKTC